jgi:lantibiotic modifying enzyme
MTLSSAEIANIVKEATDSRLSATRSELRELLSGLEGCEFRPGARKALPKLCAAGADYGWRKLAAKAKGDLLAKVSIKAQANLRRSLQRDLERITRPCLELEWKSFGLALNSIGLPASTDTTGRMFLRDKPSHRLFMLFKKFPVLAHLWCLSINQWRDHVVEVVRRFAVDRRAVSRSFFSNRPLSKITGVHLALSDAHHSGRTVVRLQFEIGSVIYKPRSGAGESEWFSFLEWMNRNGFQPRLRAARVLERKSYCWMEDVKPGPCKNAAAARRFYERMGGMIAAAHLLKLVDCHRENVIASGEEPVLVDIDTLWHVSPFSKTLDASAVLYRTGFFPSANPRSLQSRSSALGPGTKGSHLPRLAGKPLEAASYQRELTRGFARAWRSILGKAGRRDALSRRLQRIRSRQRRWIYWATEKYAAISKASLQPSSLHSSSERDELIRHLCAREIVSRAVVNAEVRALKQLDIPYFTRRTNETIPSDNLPLLGELSKAIRRALTLHQAGSA